MSDQNFSSVTKEKYREFIENYPEELKMSRGFGLMHEQWEDTKTGEKVANMMHGFFQNMYSIKDLGRNDKK